MKWSKACIIFGGPSVSAVFVTWMYDLKIMCVDLIDEMAKVPSADPIEKPQSFKFEATKDIKFDRLNKYRNAILNNKN